MKNLKVMKNDWSGKPMFSIFRLNKKGEKALDENGDEKRPAINFGINKARIILAHLEELKAFVESHEN